MFDPSESGKDDVEHDSAPSKYSKLRGWALGSELLPHPVIGAIGPEPSTLLIRSQQTSTGSIKDQHLCSQNRSNDLLGLLKFIENKCYQLSYLHHAICHLLIVVDRLCINRYNIYYI